MRVLVVNAGSSSLKLRVVGDGDVIEAAADLPATAGEFDAGAARAEISAMPRPDAAGHRVVHGGPRFDAATLLTPSVEAALRDLVSLAPLHQEAGLRAVAVTRDVLPDIPAFACFDTAFHRSLPDEVSTYAIPADWRERFGLRRYGFHGLAHAWLARRAVEMCGPAAHRVVTCHLGSGASLAAVLEGVSVDTTMGFTPLEGLVMATRSGSVDPGMLLWLQTEQGMTAEDVGGALEHRSGLQGLAGSGDVRDVLRDSAAGAAAARLAIAVYTHHLAAAIASLTVSLGGLDVLVFGGGVGEHAPEIRGAAASRLAHLGVAIDPEHNQLAVPDVEITSAGAAARTLVAASREDLQIAAEVRAAVGRS